MNLVEQLLKADSKKTDELKKGTFKSARLAAVLGQEGAVDITIKEVASRRINDIVAYQFNSKGNMDYSKTFDAKLMMCIEGIVDPDLRNKELQAHFGCGSAKDLAEKLFGMEVGAISDAISALSGIEKKDADAEDEIKN